MSMSKTLFPIASIALAFAGIAAAQRVHVDVDFGGWARNVVVPQARSFVVDGAPVPHGRRAVEITGVEVGVKIVEQVATTTMDVSLKNTTSSRQEAQMVVPVPDDAVVRGFSYQGAAKEPTAKILPKDEARSIYNSIVAKMKDPSLLEFIGHNAIRSSVFPVEARSTQKVRLIYEQILKAHGTRIDYALPRSETMESEVPWSIAVSIKSKKPVSTVYSPSHDIRSKRMSAKAVSLKLSGEQVQPGPFQLSYLIEENGVSASLFAYPDPKKGGGYFLLLAGLPAAPPRKNAIKREVTLVFDRSGSMNGPKMEQTREAALQILAGLNEGESFNIMAYNETVDLFSKRPAKKNEETLRAARRYLKGIHPRGGTNIHDALLEALRQKPIADTLPIILFLTDGIPTIGQTKEKEIRLLADEHNPYKRRVFTFGVGADVNAPLLDKIAQLTRARGTYVLPNEDVEVKVSEVYKRLSGPVLADPDLRAVKKEGAEDLGRIMDRLPSAIPDMFDGDQLVLLGRYVGDDPLRLRLKGNFLGKERTFTFNFELDDATTKNAFVPRLWASRKIAVLIDAIRQAGADSKGSTILSAASVDPKLKEIVDEIVRLSTEFGILTEYTAFLAREGTDLERTTEILREVNRNLEGRAVAVRSGRAAVNQGMNYQEQFRQKSLKKYNDYWDQNLQRVQTTRVQQVNGQAFYQRGNQWIDSNVIARGGQAKADTVIRIGSPEFLDLAEELSRRNRQGNIAFNGEIMLEMDGKVILCR
jgi:Ca-activated chloride channel homolog